MAERRDHARSWFRTGTQYLALVGVEMPMAMEVAAHKTSTTSALPRFTDGLSLARPSCSGVGKEGFQVRLRNQSPSADLKRLEAAVCDALIKEGSSKPGSPDGFVDPIGQFARFIVCRHTSYLPKPDEGPIITRPGLLPYAAYVLPNDLFAAQRRVHGSRCVEDRDVPRFEPSYAGLANPG